VIYKTPQLPGRECSSIIRHTRRPQDQHTVYLSIAHLLGNTIDRAASPSSGLWSIPGTTAPQNKSRLEMSQPLNPLWQFSEDGKPSLRWLGAVPHLNQQIPDWPSQREHPEKASQPRGVHDKSWSAPLFLCPTSLPAEWIEWYHKPFAGNDSPIERYFAIQNRHELDNLHTPLPYEPWMCYWLRQASRYGVSGGNSKVASEKWRTFQDLYPSWSAADAHHSGTVSTGHPKSKYTGKGTKQGITWYSLEEDNTIFHMKTGGAGNTSKKFSDIAQAVTSLGTFRSPSSVTLRWHYLTKGVSLVAIDAPLAAAITNPSPLQTQYERSAPWPVHDAAGSHRRVEDNIAHGHSGQPQLGERHHHEVLPSDPTQPTSESYASEGSALPSVSQLLLPSPGAREDHDDSSTGDTLAPLRGLAPRDPDQNILHPKFRIDNSGLSVPSRMKPAR